MLASRVQHFSESVIRETSRIAQRYGAINLGQGMPDFDPPDEIKEAACRAIRDGFNQYAVTWGIAPLRQAIAAKMRAFNGLPWADPDEHVTVCCGATECMMATMLALVDPGDEVVIFQPFYENYGPDAKLTGATPKWVPLRAPAWSGGDARASGRPAARDTWGFDPDELRAAFSPRTKAVIINTPNNPTGKVFNRAELETIAGLCREFDAVAISDEIYEYINFTDRPHVSIASLPGMAERTVTISGLSKTFSATGWRLGYCVAPAAITAGIRKAHDFLTVGAPHPLQVAGAAALGLPQSYFDGLREHYRHRRDLFLPYLERAGFGALPPDGAYYVMADFSALSDLDDVSFVRRMIETVGVAGVPGSSFHDPKELGRKLVRFMFAKRDETLHAAGERLLGLREKLTD
ncbi:Methionine aminotransferase [Gemmata obscuriglobus]|uniref:Aminotransferase n=1 Tax=Gemmata obscuriglobus TaxID=114 RepID=A0A2Z3H6Z5_9BACT|nr:aminotransferase class I/II-fold pyridoxal phosphate-dependent enzyme [Gemmata obscuriglobus]AWM41548.1 aminotransferase [Gemmata obscuriglobus]QEG32537.1 Methionine aminotransferase [Gemmata obscuriglobus]VTS11893.1 aminotransferase : Aminotransferase OS=Solibacter usitatus (strain Ellin6076) GN=Acid_3616 PE=3 SV=1: Aminotran_1_2 [Gemmata obscuriglobus UQM 2246]